MNTWLMITVLVVMSLFAVAAFHYIFRVVKKPELIYKNNSANQEILQQCQTLHRRFWVTPWMFSTHLQLIVLGLKKAFAPKLEYDRNDVLTAKDGGTLAVEWLGYGLPEERPTLVLLHTISGSAQSMRSFVRDIHEHLGWRVAVCIRRGHSGLPLTSAKFNTMGCSEDFSCQLEHIERHFPQSPLFAVGISAGSGVLARYLGEVGSHTPIKAAVAYCPGYDLEVAFQRSHRFYSQMMAKKLVKTFIAPKADSFSELASYQACLAASDLHELHDHMYEIAGYENQQAYLDATNAALVFEDIKVPMLVLNAHDDPVCHIDNALEKSESIVAMDNVILVLTERGSHCAYFEGLSAKPWANRMIGEYLKVVSGQLKK